MNNKQKSKNIKSKCFGVVIQQPKEGLLTDLSLIRSTIVNQWREGFAVGTIHDKDLDNEGKPKRVHLHLYLETLENHTYKQVLNMLLSLVDINKDAISVEPTNNDTLLVQYQLHENDQNKVSYEVGDMLTNDNEVLSLKLSKTYEKPMSLEEQLFSCECVSDLVRTLGADSARKYLTLWRALHEETNNSLIDRTNELEKHIADLESELSKYEAFIGCLKTYRLLSSKSILELIDCYELNN